MKLAGLSTCVVALALLACAPAPAPTVKPLPPEIATALTALTTAPDQASAEQAMELVLTFWMQSQSASVNFLIERAAIAEAHNDIAKAMTLLSEAITLEPDFAEPYVRRAGLAFAREDYATALSDLTTAIRLEPRQFIALAGLGSVYEALNRPADALKAYRAALALHPRLEQARQGEARTARKVEGVET